MLTVSVLLGSHILLGKTEYAWLAPKPTILVMSKTAGFRHSSIKNGQEALTAMAKENGWTIELTEDAKKFTPDNLKTFSTVIFLSTTGDILNREQEESFEKWLEGGGGLIGIHAATDTEYDWPWYGKAIGAYFVSHPQIQDAKIIIEDKNHPTTKHLGDSWVKNDEWYNFKSNPRANVKVLASLDESSYQGGSMNGDHPIIWTNTVGKGKVWYTGLGHTEASYTDEKFLRSLKEAILWVNSKEEEKESSAKAKFERWGSAGDPPNPGQS
jgi:type 1 glutamine amidotransferase